MTSVPRDRGSQDYVPPPDLLPAFPLARRARPKTRLPWGGLRARWKDSDRIYEWDYRHGAVEVYDRRGRHLGQFDPATGLRQKPADPLREVEP
ncbi:colicin E3/pyocin S6 family cytotoxin [Paracraurococcus lichenis]|uniref:Colicin E3/pyocin S6 family cytotoxin n=1 Tax=Paracraurococcus lichenis TaxID=3064888 RepID=A0ABT9DTA1_9PROT|nr:colicin E3/pyocin S6 family cytotoxin [Paracraurococcus sp. LOR1-02]MDO9707103.1 colicin E3/pyocin S6 family cytotoxin [Paracraurococcus sp. LOR1-02]